MADMQSRIAQPDADATSPTASRINIQEMDHAMVSARARVLSNSAAGALRNWAAEVEPAAMGRMTPAQQAAALYGAVLAAVKFRDYDEAQVLLTRLTERVRGEASAERLAQLLGVELLLAKGDSSGALQLLGKAGNAEAATSRPKLFLTAQARLQNATKTQPELGRSPASTGTAATSGLAASIQDLQTWVAGNPRDAQAWQLLASAYAEQGRTLSAIRAQAEVNAAQLDYPAALARFKTAQDWARKNGAGTDHYEASIVDTRTRQVELLVREQALER
jgi:predicted Zn-dependent protease